MKSVIIKYEKAQRQYAFVCTTAIEKARAETFLTKEPGTINWLEKTLRSGDVFVDIGANVGLYSIFAAKQDRTIQVYAIEPHIPSAQSLIRNIVKNDLVHQVHLLTCALGYEAEFRDFNYRAIEAGASGSQLGHQVGEDGKIFTPALTERKCSLPLDDLIMDRVILPPTLIKIDVDGNENGILTGMSYALRRPELRSVQIEIHPKSKEAILKQMAETGFTRRVRHNTAAGKAAIKAGADPESIAYNIIFSKEPVDA